MSLGQEYLDRALGSPSLAAAKYAKDLNRDDPQTFKVGYSIENAVLAALELFPEVKEKSIRELNGWDPA